mgnify:CR=1 FL=1|mmetsp:Transcript_7228/g.10689  ORF Transcript_7228/g.10689 Transcript_7228/m.10689 type:complete len:176 (+) Transcript_7228:1795-2322(+)
MSQKLPLSQASDNPRKIPQVIFIEQVEQYAKHYGPQQCLDQLNELYSKYKFMEAQLLRSKQVLKNKLPDINNAIQMIDYLRTVQTDMTVDFQLGDNVWTKAHVPQTDRVGLWLGANVMLEYSHEEAYELLQKNLSNANTALASTDEDLKFLKEQITTCEVNIARVYNYCVTHRQS